MAAIQMGFGGQPKFSVAWAVFTVSQAEDGIFRIP